MNIFVCSLNQIKDPATNFSDDDEEIANEKSLKVQYCIYIFVIFLLFFVNFLISNIMVFICRTECLPYLILLIINSNTETLLQALFSQAKLTNNKICGKYSGLPINPRYY